MTSLAVAPAGKAPMSSKRTVSGTSTKVNPAMQRAAYSVAPTP